MQPTVYEKHEGFAGVSDAEACPGCPVFDSQLCYVTLNKSLHLSELFLNLKRGIIILPTPHRVFGRLDLEIS